MALRLRVFDIEFPAAKWLLDRDEDAQASAVVAQVGQGRQTGCAAG